jgi:hypothetical protein
MTYTTTLTGDLRALRKARAIKDETKQAYDEAKALYDQLERDLIERMEHEGVQGQKTDGINFVPTKTVYAQIQDRSEFVDWALENDASLIEHRERKALLNELVREKLDNGEPLPPGLGFRVDEGISQRAA